MCLRAIIVSMKKLNPLHIWKIPLDITEVEVKELFPTLTAEEQENATRFRFDKHRRRYVASHAAMRKILADHLNISDAELNVVTDRNGKPYIPNNPVYFNLSHSEEMAILALSENCSVGIDVEYVDQKVNAMSIANRFFHPLEAAQLEGLPGKDLVNNFFRCWTAKEAYLKAMGVGITEHLKVFALKYVNTNKPYVMWVDQKYSEVAKWSVYNIEFKKHYIGNIVSTSCLEQIVYYKSK